MKNRLGVIFLAVCCVALIVVLVIVNKNAGEQKKRDTDSIANYSNRWVETSLQLDKQKETNAELVTVVVGKNQALLELTNNYTTLSGELDKTSASLKTAQQDVEKRDAKIADLELQNTELNAKAADLSLSITNLSTQIAETQQKLATAEGDKSFLEKELQRLMSEKAALEKQFNDLVVLRAQVAKLREELTVSRRLDWIRRGIFTSTEQKGGERLIQGNTAPTFTTETNTEPPKPNHYDLNVEVNSDGTVHVIPPPTNSPAKTP